jgi:hypothetical protein
MVESGTNDFVRALPISPLRRGFRAPAAAS